MNELDLQRQLRSLPRECPPPRDLWPELAAQLPPRRRPLRLPLALAAGLAGLLALGLWLRAPEPAQPLAADAIAVQRQDADQIDQSSPVPGPDLAEALAEIDRAAQAVESAIGEDPHAHHLYGLLADLRSQEIELRALAGS